MRKAEASSAGCRGVKSAALCSAVGLTEVSVDGGDVSSSLLVFPALWSCVVDPECGGLYLN